MAPNPPPWCQLVKVGTHSVEVIRRRIRSAAPHKYTLPPTPHIGGGGCDVVGLNEDAIVNVECALWWGVGIGCSRAGAYLDGCHILRRRSRRLRRALLHGWQPLLAVHTLFPPHFRKMRVAADNTSNGNISKVYSRDSAFYFPPVSPPRQLWGVPHRSTLRRTATLSWRTATPARSTRSRR